MTDTNLIRFRAAVAGALAHLESRREEVNDLNVFPVADGDTGDNMVLTLRAVLDELDRLQDGNAARTIDEIGREEIVQSVARAALLGARGNSGVILSQLIRGAAEELVSRPGQLIDATLIGAALANAADRAYASVREPAEGTILTVAREMAHGIMADLAHGEDAAPLGPATEPREQDLAIAKTLERAVEAGTDSVKRGPEMLAALREAGVVDAGGHALTVIFAGVVAALRDEEPPELEHYAPAKITHPEHSSSTYRYCTNFAVTGRDLAPVSFAPPLERLGDSVLVVGDANTLKVHLHTDEPERATALFDGVGEVSHLDVADMRAQVTERELRLAAGSQGNGGGAHAVSNGVSGSSTDPKAPAKKAGARVRVRCGALAVVSGSGLARMYGELGVHTIDGGPTLNPSTYELLAGIHEVPAEEVVVLPGSANVVMAAERAAELSDKQVLVVPATSQQAGLAVAVALQSDRGVQENAQGMHEALDALRTGAVAPAARADAQGRFQQGDAVGFVEEQVVAWGKPRETLLAVLQALAADTELISVLAGDEAPLELSELEGIMDGHVELELRHGGQPAYWWLLAAE
ncbi:MAG TPA: DAK2 domain-containing protein [Solirubrobacteraceae bacterium]|nr:DAK2 domain-containing protein [Solirubrobacteraceae bacterium]